MNRDKQIEEMGVVTDLLIDFDEMGFAPTTLCPDPEAYAIEWKKKLVNALKGYRKASDVAREIFAEIENILDRHSISYLKVGQICGEHYYDGVMQFDIAELKKKYTEVK